MKDWTDLPKNNLEIDDGPMAMLTIRFSDGTLVSLGDGYQMPDGGWAAVKEILTLFQSSVSQ